MAITNYYVRATNGADVAGQGTTHMTAYQTPQFALDDVGATHGKNVTEGDRINICASALEGANVLAAPLSLVAYGAPGTYAKLTLRGYTAVANDGGVGEIDCNANTMWADATADNINLIDLDIHNGGAHTLVALDSSIWIMRSALHDTEGNFGLLSTGLSSLVAGSRFYDAGSAGAATASVCSVNGAYFVGNYVRTSAFVLTGIYSGTTQSVIDGNIVVVDRNGAGRGIYLISRPYNVVGNVVYHTFGNSTAQGMLLGGGAVYTGGMIDNNIVCGFAGAGGVAIQLNNETTAFLGHNAFYNNTANVSGTNELWMDETAHDVALGADPFTNAAGGDFSLTAAAQALLRSEGWPESYLGASTDPHITIGVVQYGEAGVPCDYPLPEDVENGIVYGSGAFTGTLVCPAGGRTCYRWPDYVPCRRP